jgi:hypothetical protein
MKSEATGPGKIRWTSFALASMLFFGRLLDRRHALPPDGAHLNGSAVCHKLVFEPSQKRRKPRLRDEKRLPNCYEWGKGDQMLVVFKVPVVAVVTEPIVAGSVAIVALHFNVTALSAGTVVMEHARIDGLTRFTAGVEGFNSGHGASQYFRVVVRKAVHVMRGFSFLA